MADCDLDECFKVAQDVARKAGKQIREAFSAEKRIELKESIADLVTETDQNVEKMIFSTFREHFPTHSFIGEESVAAGAHCNLTDNPTWIVDPVDGTTNFVHRFPFTCVSIALLVNKKTEVAVVYNPILDEMYTARPGQGSFCNGEKLAASTIQKLDQALLCAEFGSSRDPEKLAAKIQTMKDLVTRCHGIRSMGSAALLMCFIAAGRADGYVEFGIHCWDIAAGDLIVREAGGVTMGPDGGPLDLMSRSVLCAGTQQLAEQMVPHIINVQFDRD